MKLGIFRTFLFAGLISGVLVPAVAQQLNCSAQGTVSTPLRAEGLTELTGDIIITCLGGTPTASGAPVPTTDVIVFLTTQVTSRIYANGWSEAMLIIDEPPTGTEPLVNAHSTQLACADPNGICTVTGTGTGVGTYDGSVGRPNIFLGRVTANAVIFPSVPVDPPGTSGARILRITNLRVNVTPFLTNGQVGTYPVQAFVAPTLPDILPVPVPNSQPIVGYIQNSADFSLRSPDNTSVANNGFAVSQCGAPQRVGVFRAAESFGRAFRKRTIASFVNSETSPIPAIQNTPGGIYDSESGFYNPALTAPTVDFATVGLADAGTRLRACIANLPAGSQVFVSTSNVSFSAGNLSAATTGAVARLVQNEVGPFVPTAATGTLEGVPVAELPVASGMATAAAVWEVLGTNVNSAENFDFAIWMQSCPIAGTASLSGSYAPAPPTFYAAEGGTASSTLPVPRFVSPISVDCPTPGYPGAALTTTALTVTPGPTPGPLDSTNNYLYTFTATVSSPNAAITGAAAGTVRFFVGGFPDGVPISTEITTSGGTASASGYFTGGSEYGVWAAFTPADPHLLGTSHSYTAVFPVFSHTSTGLTVVPTGAPNQYSLTAAVTIPGVTPTAWSWGGTVTFYDNGTAIAGSSTALPPAGTATFNAILLGGGHSLTAIFTPTFTQVIIASTSPGVSLTVPASSTSTTLVSVPTGVFHQYSLTATVTTPSPATTGAPVGTVTFYANGFPLSGSTPLGSGGTASLTTVLGVGGNTLTAVFTPSNSQAFAASTSAGVPIAIAQGATGVAITSSRYPSLPGQAVTFTATVTGEGAGPTGTVQFTDGSLTLGSAALVGGQASVTSTPTTPGVHDIVAAYAGDGTYAASSGRFGQRVDRVTGSLALSAGSAGRVSFGQTVTFTATLAPAPPAGVAAATGTVQFQEGSTVIGTASLANGTATLAISTLASGTHQIVAIYGGDGNWYGTHSPAATVMVNVATTAIALTSSATATEVRLTAVLTPAAGGSVQFLDTTGNTVLGSVQLANGTATLTLAPADVAKAGGHTITAVYPGSTGFAGSTSNGVTFPALVNGASGFSAQFAPEEMVTLYGTDLTDASTSAGAATLPLTLGGLSVNVTDAAGAVRACGLSYVSPSQVNFLLPAGLAPGAVLVTVMRAGVAVASMPLTIARVAPGLYGASQTVRGGGEVYLVLYGTGIRNRSDLAAVTCVVNGTSVPVLYAGAQPDYAGLDQVNVRLPAALSGPGTLNVSLTVDGRSSNTMTVAMP
jgi:uncharacterized protein (TIGR03437 family)